MCHICVLIELLMSRITTMRFCQSSHHYDLYIFNPQWSDSSLNYTGSNGLTSNSLVIKVEAYFQQLQNINFISYNGMNEMPTSFNSLRSLETTLQNHVTDLIYFLSLRTKSPICFCSIT